jgi:hypothetical protein
MFSWALPSGELGGLPGEFYQFANSIRSELSAVSVRPLEEAASLLSKTDSKKFNDRYASRRFTAFATYSGSNGFSR